ncbi:MAG TPA: RIP metalloprotease RseP, partial [Vicinamibacterales bacterium]
GAVTPGSPADRVGIRAGDRILTVAGSEIDTWEDLNIQIMTRPDRDVAVTLLRDGRTEALTVRPGASGRYEVGDIGVLPDVSPRVAAVIPGDPADRAGVRVGDEIVEVNGERMVFMRQTAEALRRIGGRRVDLHLRRNGQDLRLEIIPESREGYPVWIGITMTDATKPFDPGPLEAIQLSVESNIKFSGLIFRTLGGLFIGETSVRQLQGPVAIAQLSGESAAAGWVALFTLMATISLNLGLLNLMPIPVLDGGHILIMALEGIARRDFSMAVKEKMLLAGFVLLMMLMVTVIYNDLMRIPLIQNLIPWRN